MIIAALRLLRSAIISTRQVCIALAMLLATALPVAAQSFTLTLQPNTIPSGTNGVAYNQLITAVGGNGPYTFAVTAGSLPPGIVLDSDGTLHGTPTTPIRPPPAFAPTLSVSGRQAAWASTPPRCPMARRVSATARPSP
jgi:hypothetical protein